MNDRIFAIFNTAGWDKNNNKYHMNPMCYFETLDEAVKYVAEKKRGVIVGISKGKQQ